MQGRQQDPISPTDAAEPDAFSYLYPPIEPDASGSLDVGQGHSIWWEASGSPDGIPIIFLHGGPGAPSRPLHRRFFDPAAFRLVAMHQRGCGRSTPLAETRGNTTQALIADIEMLRDHLGIDRWAVTGGSWGSCLSLAYGETHPGRCLGFSLTGIVLNRAREMEWWWNGTRMLFPEAYDALVAHLPADDRDDPRLGYHRLLTNPDPAVHLPAAKALCLFSAATVQITPSAETLAAYEDPAVTLPLARLFVHYSVNRFFLNEGQLLRDVSRITHLPCFLVAGRYDVTTPPDAAWALHRAWPGSQLTIVREGAHGLGDPAMGRAFLAAAEALKAAV